MTSRALLRSVGQCRQHVRKYHEKTDFKFPHMNELPVPSGSWQEYHNQRQRKYNATLAFGISFAAFSLFCAKQAGVLKLYLTPDSID